MSAGRGCSRLAAASLVGLGVFSAPVLAAPPADIKAYCASKWSEYSMQAYCVRQEQSAQATLARGVDDQAIWALCYQKWDSWQMVAPIAFARNRARRRAFRVAVQRGPQHRQHHHRPRLRLQCRRPR
jgi:hypothetical protein